MVTVEKISRVGHAFLVKGKGIKPDFAKLRLSRNTDRSIVLGANTVHKIADGISPCLS